MDYLPSFGLFKSLEPQSSRSDILCYPDSLF
jgi:hypothetical protein